jgi:hypothetical protein
MSVAMLCSCALFSSSEAMAQDDKEQLDNRILYTKYYLSDFVNDTSRWAWEMDVVYRRQSQLGDSDWWGTPLRLSVRPWIAFQVSKLTRVSFNPIGIFHSAPRFPLETDLDRDFERELRTTLQINNYAYFKRWNFTHRLRFEYRWRGVDKPEVRENLRVRYRLRTRVPLNTDYFYKNNTLYLCQYSEMHVEFGMDYGTNYFSQNRNYLGLGYRFWDWTRVELGYIYQINTRPNNFQTDISQGLMTYIFIDIMSKNHKRYNYSF